MHWQLSLDENFVVVNTSQIKDVEFKKFVFPGGEIGFKLNSRLDCEDEVIISHRITDSQKLMELIFSVDAGFIGIFHSIVRNGISSSIELE